MAVDLEPQLLEILVCPCPQHAPLRPEPAGGAEYLICTSCGRGFPIRDGIPVLLLEEATAPSESGDSVEG